MPNQHTKRPQALRERYMQKVDVRSPDECWTWTAASLQTGYGLFRFGKRMVLAHRIALEIETGKPLPDGAVVCHICDNPRCVNPSHLVIGTSKENSQDMVAKGRSVNGESRDNAKLTNDDVLAIRSQRNISASEFARMLGVTQSLVSGVRRGQRWAHIKTLEE